MKISLSMILFLVHFNSYAWGPHGHRMVGGVAEKYLSNKAKRKLRKFLGDTDLAKFSLWADEIKSDPQWKHASPWHYVNIADGKTYENSPKSPAGDIYTAMEEMEEILKGKKSSLSKAEAIKFLVHLIGDLHQPLHHGRAEDRGGNTIILSWFDESSNLHRVWDSDMIESQGLSYSEYMRWLPKPTKEELRKWKEGGPKEWGEETRQQRDKAYSLPNERKKYWEYSYMYEHKPFYELQLAKAGYRLAVLFNRIF